MTDELFGINVRGPDDIVATRDYAEACALAHVVNGIYVQMAAAYPDPMYPRCWAIPGIWQGTPESHVTNLADPGDDYRGMLEKARQHPYRTAAWNCRRLSLTRAEA